MSTQNPNSIGHHPRPSWTPASTQSLFRIAVEPGLRKWQNQPRTATVAPATLTCLVCLLILPLTPVGLAYRPLVANLGRQPIGPAAALVAWKAAERQRTAQARLAWRLIGPALTAFFVGDLLFFSYQSSLEVSPFPSWADIAHRVVYSV